MIRVLRVYQRFFQSSLQRELEFRANFLAKVAQNIIWMTFFILILKVIYSNTKSVAGWSEGNGYVLAATVFFLHAFIAAFFATNLQEIPEKVRKGTLDFDILKPVDTQFLVSLRKFNFDEVGTLAVGLAMIVVGLTMSGHAPTFIQVCAYGMMLFAAVGLFYAFELCLMTLGIWLVRVDNLWVLGESVFTVARFPIDIYSPPMRKLLTYALPLALISTEPSKVLLGTRAPTFAFFAIVWTIVALLVARFFWRFALSHYASASS